MKMIFDKEPEKEEKIKKVSPKAKRSNSCETFKQMK
jgi:hypothetical protein